MAKKSNITEKGTSTQQKSTRQKSQLVTYFIIFICGFLSGIAFTVYKGGSPTGTKSAAVEAQPGPQNDETSQAIINLEAEVTAHPENFENWIRLGHLYYDTNQPDKAIGAYTRSLELHSGDANLLTDLGVMYRRTGKPEKAIEFFDKAIAQDPNHQPSRFNKGIVMMHDLGDVAGAVKVWEELLAIAPEAKTANGQSIREFVDKIKTELVK